MVSEGIVTARPIELSGLNWLVWDVMMVLGVPLVRFRVEEISYGADVDGGRVWLGLEGSDLEPFASHPWYIDTKMADVSLAESLLERLEARLIERGFSVVWDRDAERCGVLDCSQSPSDPA